MNDTKRSPQVLNLRSGHLLDPIVIIQPDGGYTTTEGWTGISSRTYPPIQSPSVYNNKSQVFMQQSTIPGDSQEWWCLTWSGSRGLGQVEFVGVQFFNNIGSISHQVSKISINLYAVILLLS